MDNNFLLKPGSTYSEKKISYYMDLAGETLRRYGESLDKMFDKFGNFITKTTDSIVPFKRENRDYNVRTRVSRILDGEKLSKKELFKLGFYASGVKFAYTAGAACTGIVTNNGIDLNGIDPVLLVIALYIPVLGALHQREMSKKIQNAISSLDEPQREELRRYILEDKDVYEMKDALNEIFRF